MYKKGGSNKLLKRDRVGREKQANQPTLPLRLLSPPRPSSGRFPRGMTPATRSTECAAAHRPCGRLPSRATRRAHERDVAVPAAPRRAGGDGVARGGRHLPSSLFDPATSSSTTTSASRPCHAFVPFCSHPACPLPPPRPPTCRPLSRLSRGLSSLYPPSPRAPSSSRHRWLARLSGSCPPFASALLGDRAGRIRRSFFPGSSASSPKVR